MRPPNGLWRAFFNAGTDVDILIKNGFLVGGCIRTLLPATLAFVSFGIVSVQVRVCTYVGILTY